MPNSVKNATTAPDKQTPEKAPSVDPTHNIQASRGKNRADGSLRLDVTAPAERHRGVTSKYWIGVTHECSYHNVTCGGIDFPRWTGNASFDERGQPFGGHVEPGAIAHLTESQVEACLQSIARRVVRTVGTASNNRVRHQIVTADSPVFTPSKTDRALAEFIYMVKAEDMAFNGRQSKPTPLSASSAPAAD